MHIQVTMRYSEKELQVLTRFLTRSKRFLGVSAMVTLAGIAELIAGVVFQMNGSNGMVFFVCGMILIFMANIVFPQMIKGNVKKINATFVGKVSCYELSDEEVIVHSDYGESHYGWNSFTKVQNLKEYVALSMINRQVILLEKEQLSREEIDWVLEKGR